MAIKKDFIKNNLFIIIVCVNIALLVVIILLFNASKSTASYISSLQAKSDEITKAKQVIDDFYKSKPYLEDEAFRKKVPPNLVRPFSAVRNAGIIVKSLLAEEQMSFEVETKQISAQSSGGGPAQTQGGSVTANEVIPVGSKNITPLGFTIKFVTMYDSFMKILDKLSSTEPVVAINKYGIERDKDNPRLLKIKLELDAFTNIESAELSNISANLGPTATPAPSLAPASGKNDDLLGE
jgi:hypothetical protein